jgi:hypothetical protein
MCLVWSRECCTLGLTADGGSGNADIRRANVATGVTRAITALVLPV